MATIDLVAADASRVSSGVSAGVMLSMHSGKAFVEFTLRTFGRRCWQAVVLAPMRRRPRPQVGSVLDAMNAHASIWWRMACASRYRVLRRPSVMCDFSPCPGDELATDILL